MSQAVAVVVAAGNSARMGAARPKQFATLGNATVLERAVRAVASCPGLAGVVVVLPPDAIGTDRAESVRAWAGVLGVVPGGPSRMASVLAGVEAASEAEFVLVHDAARPFVTSALVEAVLRASRAHGAAIPAVPARDTVKRADDAGFVLETLDRSTLRLAQTPQGARRSWLLDALRAAQADGVEVTDEAQALERDGRKIALVPGDPGNTKITTLDDLDIARRRADGGGDLRVGHGYDVHRFDGNRALVLGGVLFEGERGLSGHSDADVVLHAAMDALLGAAGLPDIGHHFPPSDPRYAGADSSRLAHEVTALVDESGWRIANLDLTLIAERPKIASRVPEMRAAIAAAFEIDAGAVGLKATTHEGLGALGRGEGIGCHAVALVRR
jgi:2-C-methyl-D-erythritol 4-phosphate cytidylyltransferase/2-C-methyl-D-erythritol 2,4-cyclodiphosphate synthase